MSDTPWLFLAAAGWQRLRVAVLGLIAVGCIVYGVTVLLHDVFEVLRPDGAPCHDDSNCLSLCHHPALRPSAGYCSSDCARGGNCSAGMRCRQVADGWRCVWDRRASHGKECGEDSDCASERCMGLYARDGEWLQVSEAGPEHFRGAFCLETCAATEPRCPLGSDCIRVQPNAAPLCVPSAQRFGPPRGL